jgi:amino acid transporter
MSGYVGLLLSQGAGRGTPLIFVVVTLVLLAFSVGYCAMVRHVPTAGAFYAYITAGLGRVVGLGASFTILACYIAVGIGAYAFTGIVCEQFVALFGGPSLSWWCYALVYWAIATCLAHFHVGVSAKVLGVLLLCEVLVVLWFDAAVFSKAGSFGDLAFSFSWPAVARTNVGVSLIFTILLFLGFEATAIYRDEAREPARTIPRATILVVLFIGCFYAISSMALIIGLGAPNAVRLAQMHPTTVFANVGEQFCGTYFNRIAGVLILTSVFAADLAVHNVVTRYIYSLASDKVLPNFLAVAHRKHQSPYRASAVAGVIYLGVALVLIAAGLDEQQIYARLGGIAAFGLISAMALTSLSAIVLFRRQPVDLGSWQTLYAPALGFLGLCGMVWLGFLNLPALMGGSRLLANGMVVTGLAIFGFGAAKAVRLRSAAPSVYLRIGGG